jgi:hypothetical protein
MDPDVPPPSDIGIFLHGLEIEQHCRSKIAELLQALYNGYKLMHHAIEVLLVITDKAITLVPFSFNKDQKHLTGPGGLPRTRIILKKFADQEAILSECDIDCCCVAYDEKMCAAHARAVRALITGTNHVNLDHWSPTHEQRILKYAERGFALTFYTSLPLRTDDLEVVMLNGEGAERVHVTCKNVRTCMAETVGLQQVILADMALKLGQP